LKFEIRDLNMWIWIDGNCLAANPEILLILMND
jgi:hypothetical protein